jgi:hypothetical protein
VWKIIGLSSDYKVVRLLRVVSKQLNKLFDLPQFKSGNAIDMVEYLEPACEATKALLEKLPPSELAVCSSTPVVARIYAWGVSSASRESTICCTLLKNENQQRVSSSHSVRSYRYQKSILLRFLRCLAMFHRCGEVTFRVCALEECCNSDIDYVNYKITGIRFDGAKFTFSALVETTERFGGSEFSRDVKDLGKIAVDLEDLGYPWENNDSLHRLLHLRYHDSDLCFSLAMVFGGPTRIV